MLIVPHGTLRFRMATQDLVLVEVAETKSVATLDPTFIIMAECTCGHARELHTLFLRRQLGAGITVATARQRLRCHKCQAKMPAIRIYRRRV
ncbi:MAG TPA: hypothetical protein VHW25_05650 [Steroidobacteraceae bacterium]|nr:hypothetical protein [Steroidobacteraceae bacterium]